MVKVIKLVRTDTHQVILSIMHSVHNAYKEGSFPLWSSFSGTFTFFLTFPLPESVFFLAAFEVEPAANYQMAEPHTH